MGSADVHFFVSCVRVAYSGEPHGVVAIHTTEAVDVHPVPMYWWNRQPNFGDAMNPFLIHSLFGIEVEWSPIRNAMLVGAGSILQFVGGTESRLSRELHVWGSGYMKGIMTDTMATVTSPKVIHHAVRGVRSAELGKLPAIALGDPGVLCSLAFPEAVTTSRCGIGIVPHLVHQQDSVLQSHRERDSRVTLIDVTADPPDVIRQIASCDFVFSSSLHGLVVADSFGIPNQWLQCDPPLGGVRWKFDDYYSAFDTAMPEPIRLTAESNIADLASAARAVYDRPGISGLQDGLIASFPFR